LVGVLGTLTLGFLFGMFLYWFSKPKPEKEEITALAQESNNTPKITQ
jgi:hypothetical protein